MPDIITNAREIYYKTPKKLTGTNQIVPVRGVYVANVYKPPQYMEPILRINTISTNHCTIENFKEDEVTPEPLQTTHHLYDIDIDSSFNIDWYSTYIAPNHMNNATHHLYDIDIDSSYNIEYYQSTIVPNQSDNATHHLYDVDVNFSFDIDLLNISDKSSQPEPILRVIEFTTSKCKITNLTKGV